jgi:hypothetical protein
VRWSCLVRWLPFKGHSRRWWDWLKRGKSVRGSIRAGLLLLRRRGDSWCIGRNLFFLRGRGSWGFLLAVQNIAYCQPIRPLRGSRRWNQRGSLIESFRYRYSSRGQRSSRTGPICRRLGGWRRGSPICIHHCTVVLQYPLVPLPSLDLRDILLDLCILPLVGSNLPDHVLPIARIEGLYKHGELLLLFLCLLDSWQCRALDLPLFRARLGAVRCSIVCAAQLIAQKLKIQLAERSSRQPGCIVCLAPFDQVIVREETGNVGEGRVICAEGNKGLEQQKALEGRIGRRSIHAPVSPSPAIEGTATAGQRVNGSQGD